MTVRARRGLTLPEVIMAVVLLALLASSHSLLTLKFTQRQKAVTLGVYRSAALESVVNRWVSMPFDSLSTKAGCTTVNDTPMAYTKCITVTTISNARKTVRIILTPSTLLKPDTVSFDRAKMSTTNPLG
jgi:prepilin-type N-terminal cleavage/methylation domain-containing protein